MLCLFKQRKNGCIEDAPRPDWHMSITALHQFVVAAPRLRDDLCARLDRCLNKPDQRISPTDPA
jgi:hypothetical protein